MSRRIRGGLGTALVLILVIAQLVGPLVRPASATGDLLNGQSFTVSGGSGTSSGSYPNTNINDGNDATVAVKYGCSTNCHFDFDLGTAQLIDHARFYMPCAFYPSDDPSHLYTAYDSISVRASNSGAPNGAGTIIAQLTGTSPKYNASGTPGCGEQLLTSTSGATAYRYVELDFGDAYQTGCGGGYCGGAMATAELVSTPVIASASAYFKNLFVSQTSAYIRISWQWAQTYTGTWSADDNTFSVGCGGNFGSGTSPTLDSTEVTLDYFASGCLVTDAGPFVLSVADTGANQTAAITIPSTARGNVPVGDTGPADPAQQPRIDLFIACISPTTDFCGGAPHATPVGDGWVKYRVSADDPTATATVTLYPIVDGVAGSPTFTDTGVVLNGTTSAGTIVTHYYSPLAVGHYVLVAQNASGSSTAALEFVAGRAEVGLLPLQPSLNELCGPIDPACAVRNAVKSITCQNAELCWIERLVSVPSLLLTDAADQLYAKLAAKQPFATILGSGAVILGQLSRATSAVTSTDSCSGVTIVVPLRVMTMTAPPVNGQTMPTPPAAPTSVIGMAGRTSGPVSVNVLSCQTFESVVSGWTFWPTLRTFMDVAVYAAYGYALLQRWQARPQFSA